uniref:Uncharacterized protein n=2 Tax=Caenorhabditis japonica TaxID=281687 RepID=A0A8R1EBG1_CAEJA
MKSTSVMVRKVCRMKVLNSALLFFSVTFSGFAESSAKIGEVTPYGECFDGFMPTFLRHIGTRQMDGPAYVAKVNAVFEYQGPHG